MRAKKVDLFYIAFILSSIKKGDYKLINLDINNSRITVSYLLDNGLLESRYYHVLKSDGLEKTIEDLKEKYEWNLKEKPLTHIN